MSMQLAVFLAFTAIGAFCNALDFLDNNEWENFKTKYNKSYESDLVESVRKQIYLSQKEYVRKHNERYARNETTYYMGINHLSDMLDVEVAQTLNGYTHGMSQQRHFNEVLVDAGLEVPASVDWRLQNIVTPVKDQGSCGGCWAFSATGALEGFHALKTKKLVSLSEQNLIDCSWAQGNEGCGGGLMTRAFYYVVTNKGIDTESSYPFTGKDEVCKFNSANVGATLNSWGSVRSGSESALQQVLAAYGPVSVAIDASEGSFHAYAGGIYDEPSCSSTNLDHGVLAVGYGTEGSNDYWIVKNSWGTSWGSQGYIMMSRHKNNQCGIATMASVPVS